MPRTATNGHRRRHLRRQLTRKLLVLSRKAFNFIHPSRSLAIVTNRKGQRFSLISQADYQAPVASSHRGLGQLVGFHVVCGLCDGFVVRNGCLRSCTHQTDASSSLSGSSGVASLGAAGERGVSISVQPPTPGSDGGVDVCRQYVEVPVHVPTDVDDGVPAATVKSEGPERPSTSARSKPPRPDAIAADDVSDLTFSAGEVARGKRFHNENEARGNRSLDEETNTETGISATSHSYRCNTEALMRDWREWSKRWERSVSPASRASDGGTDVETGISVGGYGIQQPRRDHESLMREWMEWSKGWERLVKSR